MTLPLVVAKGTVWNTAACLRVARDLNEFENLTFGPDFACQLEQVRPWLISGDLFYSAIGDTDEKKRTSVVSVASILLVDAASRDELVAGQLREADLKPFSLCKIETEPTFYYSSLIIQQPRHAVALFRSLLKDAVPEMQRRKLAPRSAFTISTSGEGTRHAVKSGFTEVLGRLYLEKYSFLELHTETAESHFWRRLLHSDNSSTRP